MTDHHEHDEHCGCEHTHSHEDHHHHEHEHDENCSCGHDHSHDKHHHHHEHDENCSCGHDHSHEDHHHHHHDHDPNAPYIVDGHTHEGASVGTGTLTVNGCRQTLEDVVKTELKTLADWVTEQGGIIGHIKSSLVASHTTMLSITEDDVNTISSETEEIHINLAAIVFAVPLEELKEQVEQICKKLIGMNRTEE